jgi:hypothetical protein
VGRIQICKTRVCRHVEFPRSFSHSFEFCTRYSAQDGYYPAPWNIDESSAPPEWFPQLQKPLGAPLGPATRVAGPGWRYQRLFEHAVVNADFFNVTSGTVTFH